MNRHYGRVLVVLVFASLFVIFFHLYQSDNKKSSDEVNSLLVQLHQKTTELDNLSRKIIAKDEQIEKLESSLTDAQANPPSPKSTLLNKEYISETLLPWDLAFQTSHGVTRPYYLGIGMLYFALVYMTKARLVVNLGSGGGFAPKMFASALQELGCQHKMYHVDLGYENRTKSFVGSPTVKDYDHLFKVFPDIEYLQMFTDKAAELLVSRNTTIDILNIDAAHDHVQSYKDFENYLPMMNPNNSWVILLHDTNIPAVAQTINKIREEYGDKYDVLNFNEHYAGVAIVVPKFGKFILSRNTGPCVKEFLPTQAQV